MQVQIFPAKLGYLNVQVPAPTHPLRYAKVCSNPTFGLVEGTRIELILASLMLILRQRFVSVWRLVVNILGLKY